MRYDPKRHRRQSIRLMDYDYTQAGAYFVTICAQNKACRFGEAVAGEMRLSDVGWMIVDEWNGLSRRFPAVGLDVFIVMPNHIHGVIVIENIVGTNPVGAGLVPALPVATGTPVATDTTTKRVTTSIGATTRVAPALDDTAVTGTVATGATRRVAPTLGDVVGAFKSLTTIQYIRGVKIYGWPAFHGRLWQRNYYEHIIRDEESLNRIRQYILDNPSRWSFDRDNPAAVDPEHENAWHA